MRKLFWQMNVTLDNFMEGPNRESNDTAHVVDEDFDRYATEMLKSIDAILLGRVNELPKIVFSRTLEKVEWEELETGQRECRGRSRPAETTPRQGPSAVRQRRPCIDVHATRPDR